MESIKRRLTSQIKVKGRQMPGEKFAKPRNILVQQAIFLCLSLGAVAMVPVSVVQAALVTSGTTKSVTTNTDAVVAQDSPLEVEDNELNLAPAPDPTAPSTVLHAVLNDFDRYLSNSVGKLPLLSRQHLALSSKYAASALNHWEQSSPQLADMLAEIRASLEELALITPRLAWMDVLAKELAGVARTVAQNTIKVGTQGEQNSNTLLAGRGRFTQGDELLKKGLYVDAVAHYAQSYGLIGSILLFDVNRFEQNIRNAVVSKTVGFGYAIVQNGKLYKTGGQGGLARTSADGTMVAQSAYKQMYIASTSKTLSAITLLKLLHLKGISVDAPIASYLPPDWVQGPNVSKITFRNLLNHRSGLESPSAGCCNFAGQTMPALQEVIAQGSSGASTSQPSRYRNANFSLLRVLIPRIAFVGSSQQLPSPNSPYGPFAYASWYTKMVQQFVLQPAGINAANCASNETADKRTLYYPFPAGDAKGKDHGNWVVACGATGWYLSAIDLAHLLASLRFTDTILDPATRTLMDQDFLGWLDPVAYASYVNGAFGAYRGHGGTYNKVSTCMMNYPNGYQASLLVNSAPLSSGHPCEIIKEAYDNAWQSKQ